MKASKYCWVLLVSLLLSCQTQKFKSQNDLLTFLKDPQNGYYSEKESNQVVYTLMYRPTDLLVQQSLSGTNNRVAIDSLRQHYGQYMYFNLSMSMNGMELLNHVAHDRNKFGQMVNQFAFQMNERVHLYTQSRDTIEMSDYIYPRMYGMSGSTSMMLVYPRDSEALKEDYLKLCVEDLGFLTGDVTFKIEVAQIKNEPQLRFDLNEGASKIKAALR